MKRDSNFLAKIASWYYEQGLNQEQIAIKARLSRPTISRLLNQARRQGIVEVKVNHPARAENQLSRRLEELYGLSEVIVAASGEGDGKRILGEAGAAYLERTLQDNDVIGMSWGETLYYLANAIRLQSLQNVQCVQLCGGMSAQDSDSDSSQIVRNVAERVNGSAWLLQVPLYVNSLQTRNLLMQSPAIKQVIEWGTKIKMAIIGIGSLQSSSILHSNLLSPQEEQRLIDAGTVGDILCHFLTADGQLAAPWLDERTFAFSMEQLKDVEYVVAVAGGEEKKHAIKASLKTGVIDVLITDLSVARLLVEDA